MRSLLRGKSMRNNQGLKQSCLIEIYECDTSALVLGARMTTEPAAYGEQMDI